MFVALLGVGLADEPKEENGNFIAHSSLIGSASLLCTLMSVCWLAGRFVGRMLCLTYISQGSYTSNAPFKTL